MRLVLAVCLFMIVLSGCESILEPTITRIEGIEVDEISQKRLKLRADMVFENPNPFALDLSSADMVAIVDDIELATIKQEYDTSMPANQEFKMPMTIEMDLEKLYNENPLTAIGKSMQILGERKLNVLFKGNIKVGKGSMKLKVPIDQTEEINF